MMKKMKLPRWVLVAGLAVAAGSGAAGPARAQGFGGAGIPYVEPGNADNFFEGITNGVIADVNHPRRVFKLREGVYFLYDHGIDFYGGLTMETLVPGTRVSIHWIKDTADLLVVGMRPAD